LCHIWQKLKRLLSYGWTLSQWLLEVSAFCSHTFAKTSTPLVNSIVNGGLVSAIHAKHAENDASVHNTCWDKIAGYLQRIFNRNRKLKQQVSKLNALKSGVCSKIIARFIFVCIFSRYAKPPTFNFWKGMWQHTEGMVGSIIWIVLEIYFSFQQRKNFENPITIDNVIAMSLVYYFFGIQCIQITLTRSVNL